MVRRFFALIAISSACAMPSAALAGPTAQGEARITLNIPEVCDIDADTFALGSDGRINGVVREMCNSSRGYQVIAVHRPLLAGERATIRYANTTKELDASGQSPVVMRSGQRVANVPVSIDAEQIEQSLAVGLTLSPL